MLCSNVQKIYSFIIQKNKKKVCMANWSGKLKKRGQFFNFAEILFDHF